MSKENKKMISLRLTEDVVDKLDMLSKQTGKKRTSIIEEALISYFTTTDEERIANYILEELNGKYEKAFDKLKSKLSAIDMNGEIILQILNTILFNLDDNQKIKSVVSPDNFENKVYTSAKNNVIRKIEKRQQYRYFDKE